MSQGAAFFVHIYILMCFPFQVFWFFRFKQISLYILAAVAVFFPADGEWEV